jgi:hypothetical protein
VGGHEADVSAFGQVDLGGDLVEDGVAADGVDALERVPRVQAGPDREAVRFEDRVRHELVEAALGERVGGAGGQLLDAEQVRLVLLDQFHDVVEVRVAHVQVDGHDRELGAARGRLVVGDDPGHQHDRERDRHGSGDGRGEPVADDRLQPGADESGDHEVGHERHGRDQ